MESLIADLRFALRSWRKAPAFALAAIATLALGIGANTAMFSVVSAVLLRPLPFQNPENLVRLYEIQPRDKNQGGFNGPVVYRDFEQWRSQSKLKSPSSPPNPDCFVCSESPPAPPARSTMQIRSMSPSPPTPSGKPTPPPSTPIRSLVLSALIGVHQRPVLFLRGGTPITPLTAGTVDCATRNS